MSAVTRTVLLLIASNVFMTFAYLRPSECCPATLSPDERTFLNDLACLRLPPESWRGVSSKEEAGEQKRS